jgi:hypothetical protein
MSLLDSLKFFVIEHQPARLMIFCLFFFIALSNNIPEFAKINGMPIPLDIRRIADEDGIGAAFIKKKRQRKPNSFRHSNQ